MYWIEYVIALRVCRRFELEHHPDYREPLGACLRCGVRLRRSGYRHVSTAVSDAGPRTAGHVGYYMSS